MYCSSTHVHVFFNLLGKGLLFRGEASDCRFTLALDEARTADPATWITDMFEPNCLASGFSCLPPMPRCLPKYSSSGSCDSFSLRKYSAPSAKSSLANAVNDLTADGKIKEEGENTKILYTVEPRYKEVGYHKTLL